MTGPGLGWDLAFLMPLRVGLVLCSDLDPLKQVATRCQGSHLLRSWVLSGSENRLDGTNPAYTSWALGTSAFPRETEV